MLLDGLHHGHAFTDCAAHRLFAPHVLAGLRGLDAHQRVPVRRGGDVDDVDVLALKDLTEIVVALHSLRLASDLVHAGLEMAGIDITERQQFPRHTEMRGGNAAAADDGAGDFIGWRSLATEPEHAAGNDLDGRHGGEGLEGLATGEVHGSEW